MKESQVDDELDVVSNYNTFKERLLDGEKFVREINFDKTDLKQLQLKFLSKNRTKAIELSTLQKCEVKTNKVQAKINQLVEMVAVERSAIGMKVPLPTKERL